MKRIHAVVTGRVQGVGFRNYVRNVAHALGLAGYVKNLSDGSVEVAAEGNEDAIEELRMQLYKGPAFSRVDNITEDITESRNEFKGFDVRY